MSVRPSIHLFVGPTLIPLRTVDFLYQAIGRPELALVIFFVGCIYAFINHENTITEYYKKNFVTKSMKNEDLVSVKM